MKPCTCTGTCKGKDGLAPGWRCAIEGSDLANELAFQAGRMQRVSDFIKAEHKAQGIEFRCDGRILIRGVLVTKENQNEFNISRRF